MSDFTVHHGDCVEVMASMEAESVDAVVCDPPYGLEFMGKEWDRPWAVTASASVGFEGREDNLTLPTHRDGRNANCRKCGGRARGAKRCTCSEPEWDRSPAQDMRDFQGWCVTWAEEALRILRPGGHLLAFGGTRTYHRLACAVEDAGFEIRDSITWIYASGFPKSLDVSKAIDKAAGADREVIAEGTPVKRMIPGADQDKTGSWIKDNGREFVPTETRPATPEAQQWSGWGTALKPAHEPIVVGRKPLVGTVAANVLEYGTGALNIDGCRISTDGEVLATPQSDPGKREGVVGSDLGISGADAESFRAAQAASIERTNTLGRWPANVVLSHSEGCEQVGETEVPRPLSQSVGAHDPENMAAFPHGNKGMGSVMESVPVYRCVEGCPVAELDRQSAGIHGAGAARSAIREADSTGMWGMAGDGQRYGDTGGASRFFYVAKASRSDRADGLPRAWYEESAKNGHPTVKPVELMRYLVRLVTPPGGLVLDPFLGSGTTGIAAVREGFDFVGIEKNDEYVELARTRIERAHQFLAEPQGLF